MFDSEILFICSRSYFGIDVHPIKIVQFKLIIVLRIVRIESNNLSLTKSKIKMEGWM